MRRLTLIRHGRPDFPVGEHVCLGLTDLPLSALGRLQAALYGPFYRAEHVYSSYLSRAIRTAEFIDPKAEIVQGLEEMYTGVWDGLSFSEIRRRFPQLYELRGIEPNAPIPCSEDVSSCQRRFYAAVKQTMENCEGNVAIVAHATVIGSFLCKVLGLPAVESRRFKLPYLGAYSFNYDGQFYHVKKPPLPQVQLDGEICRRLLKAAELPENICAHCQAVADEAALIARALNCKGCNLDLELIYNSALLHDICRREENHAEAGAKLIEQLGFGAAAEIIRQHHDLKSNDLDEAAVVYLADKLIAGTKKIGIEERFSASAQKCGSPEATVAHGRRQMQAQKLADRIQNILKTRLPL